MNPRSSLWYVLFWLCAGADIFFLITQKQEGRYISKILLMPLLMMAYYIENGAAVTFSRLILTGLFFSWMGDILLLSESRFGFLFIPGLISFLVTHLIYIRYFLLIQSKHNSFFKKRPLMLLVVAVYTMELLYLLWPHLENMKIPVTVYAAVISLMLACALWQYRKLLLRTSLLFISGALLFVLSDSLLSINKFYQPFAEAGVFIMLTYTSAQFLIAKGSSSHLKEEQYQAAH
jgi:uncharacterized membrane protein YhhN